MNLPTEVEGKWLLKDLSAFASRLTTLGAQLLHERCYENNLRFDTPAMTLTPALQVLRLRQDSQAHLTYKAPLDLSSGIILRHEIEITVDDFDLARQLLEALGYEVFFQYEKYRTLYELDRCHIMLDELPYGDFVEIEGPDPAAILALAERLALRWQDASAVTYTGLFDIFIDNSGHDFRDLTFANFAGINVTPEQIELRWADQSR
jgi:adenylate cyclase, class 2